MNLSDEDIQVTEETGQLCGLSPKTKKRIETIEAIIILLCCTVALYFIIPKQPAYTTQTLMVPLHFYPKAQFKAGIPIVPAGDMVASLCGPTDCQDVTFPIPPGSRLVGIFLRGNQAEIHIEVEVACPKHFSGLPGK